MTREVLNPCLSDRTDSRETLSSWSRRLGGCSPGEWQRWALSALPQATQEGWGILHGLGHETVSSSPSNLQAVELAQVMQISIAPLAPPRLSTGRHSVPCCWLGFPCLYYSALSSSSFAFPCFSQNVLTLDLSVR